MKIQIHTKHGYESFSKPHPPLVLRNPHIHREIWQSALPSHLQRYNNVSYDDSQLREKITYSRRKALLLGNIAAACRLKRLFGSTNTF